MASTRTTRTPVANTCEIDSLSFIIVNFVSLYIGVPSESNRPIADNEQTTMCNLYTTALDEKRIS